MDEITEFRRDALEALRQPLEEGRLAVARSRGHAVLPARFILVAASNPCPCGFAGDPRRLCECTPLERQRYRARLSGPIRDRIDLQVIVPRQAAGELLRTAPAAESSATVRDRVIGARARQREREKAFGSTIPAIRRGSSKSMTRRRGSSSGGSSHPSR